MASNRWKETEQSEEEEDDDLFLLDSAFENGRSFAECYRRYRSVQEFLRRDAYIALRATAIPNVVDQECLIHQSDIDGITIEWKGLAGGLKSDFRHFQILPRGSRSLQPFYPLIKKHVSQSLFTAHGFRSLKCSVGTQLIYDGSWETWIGFVPTRNMRVSIDSPLQTSLVLKYMNRLKIKFEKQLLELHRNGIARKTLAKNNLGDASRLFVLPGDQAAILQAFEVALSMTEILDLENFEPMLLTFRFGEKITNRLVLPVNEKECVGKLCVHIAHNISSPYMDLFWARHGLQEVTGSSCIITTAFSMFECANVQTNTEKSELGISKVLRDVCTLPWNIQFFQLYNDLPHRYPRTRVHPVSSSVMMMEGILPVQAQRNLYDAASRYMSEVRNNFVQCDNGVCRMEMVLQMNEVQNIIEASQFIRQDGVSALLASHAMIVPISRGFGVIAKMQNVGLHLCDVLKHSFTTRRGTGDSETVWIAYQAELAIEKMLWGRPLSFTSNIYSINLGPGLQYPTRCLTDQKGFMCLENSFACCMDEYTLPPLKLFSKDLSVQKQILNVNGLYSLVGGSSVVLGSFLVRLFLKDCHAYGAIKDNFENFFLALKSASGNGGKRIVGGVSADEIGNKLTTAKRYAWPFVFGAARKLLMDAQVDISEVIEHGIRHLDLGYFPAVKTYNQSRNAALDWKFNYGYWVLTKGSSECVDMDRRAAEMNLFVLTELETRKLCHVSQYREVGVFPWIRCTLERCLEKKLSDSELVTVLAFVSCLAFIQLGRYVDFYALRRLENELPISQHMLQMLQVQSKLLLIGVNTCKLYRLHPSVPSKIIFIEECKKRSLEKDDPDASRAYQSDEETVEQINPEENNGLLVGHIDVPVAHVPSNRCFGRWTPEELAFLVEAESLRDLSPLNRYLAYQNLCRKAGIPDRSFHAYRIKAKRRGAK